MAAHLSLSRDYHMLRHGDLLAKRGLGCAGRLIRSSGRAKETHVGKLIWWEREPMLAEVREWYGGRIVTLRSQVERSPGQWYVYRVNSIGHECYDVDAACRYMIQLAGCDYGWGNILRSSCSHLPFVRLVTSPSDDDALVTGRPPYCSQAVAMADRIAGGFDPVSHLADSFTEPGDLVRSPFYGLCVGRLFP